MFRNKNRKKISFYYVVRGVFLIGAIFFISMALMPGAVWTTTIHGKELNIPYNNAQAPLTEIVELALDSSGNLYVLTNSSDAVIAYSPSGTLLYSIYLEGIDNGINQIAVLNNQNLAVLPASGHNLFIFRKGELQQKVNLDSSIADLQDFYAKENILMFGSQKVTTTNGTKYSIGWSGYAVIAISPSGTERIFAHAAFSDLLFTKSPLTMIWALLFSIGLVGLSVMKNNKLNPVRTTTKI